MRFRHSVSLFIAVGVLFAGSLAHAQLSLDKSGGAIPGNTTFKVTGAPNTPYGIIWSDVEQTTNAGPVTLDITLDHLSDSFAIPGFVGVTNGSGVAQAVIAAPNDPALDPFVFSLQAVSGTGPYSVSNLVRLTPSLVGAFEPALNAPTLPIAGGGIATAADGELLFVGGSGPLAQRYKSRTEEWELFGATFGVGAFSQTTGLADGRVLFTGGLDLLTGQPTTAAALYDPIAGTTTTLAMGSARAGHGASLMGNGKVLITGGFAAFNLADILGLLTGVQNTTEIFDPVAGTFTPGPNMLEARGLHTSTTLSNGQVLIAGGLSVIPIINLPNISATAYRFNPATNAFTFLPVSMQGGRFLHSAVGLSNGKVLIAGGITFDLATFLQTGDPTTIVLQTLSDCQVYSQGIISSFTTVGPMAEPRAGAGLAALPNGGALIAGGMTLALDIPNAAFVVSPLSSADRFNSTGNVVAATGSMAAPRFLPVVANLPDGTVMVVGGGPAGAEIYQP
jgi:hypothetical protein